MQQTKFYMSDSFSEFPSYVERSSSKPRLLLIFVIVLLLVIAALAGLYFLGANSGRNLLSVSPASTPTPMIAAIPTTQPTPTILPRERKDLTVAILNGSGTAGAAKGVSSTLNSLGYSIGTIGNAARFNYVGITIHVKEENRDYLPLLEKDIKDANPNASVSASVDDTIKGDAEVIVGK